MTCFGTMTYVYPNRKHKKVIFYMFAQISCGTKNTNQGLQANCFNVPEIYYFSMANFRNFKDKTYDIHNINKTEQSIIARWFDKTLYFM